MNNPSVPSSVQIQPKIEYELEENALFELGQLIEQLVEIQKKEHPAARRRSQPPLLKSLRILLYSILILHK